VFFSHPLGKGGSEMESFNSLIVDEAKNWDTIQSIRQEFKPELFDQIKISSRDEALERGVNSVKQVLEILNLAGLDLKRIEPGHGKGHIIRDYINSLRLLTKLDIDPKHAFIGLIAGTLHDIGVAIVDRYQEKNRAVRHAEASALLVGWAIEDAQLDFTPEEKLLVQYAICAHTHYLGSSQVECADGVTRKIEPYVDEVDGKPIYGLWLARWIDRLDCSGPCFVCRHYLTLYRPHTDYGQNGYYEIEFKDHMQPMLRPEEMIRAEKLNRTMAEHLRMFANSQTNDSPYGKHDFGRMVELRDFNRASLARIIQTLMIPEKQMPLKRVNHVFQGWQLLLHNEIESGADKAISQLTDMFFDQLSEEVQFHWAEAFDKTMSEYLKWLDSVLHDFKKFPESWQYLERKQNALAYVGFVDEWAAHLFADDFPRFYPKA